MTRPLGYPPIPSATSKANDPLGIVAIFCISFSPNFIIEPLPNCFSICLKAMSKACFLSLNETTSFYSYLHHTLFYPLCQEKQNKRSPCFSEFLNLKILFSSMCLIVLLYQMILIIAF